MKTSNNNSDEEFKISFADKNKTTVGVIKITDGKLDFEGSATESATIFMEHIVQMYDAKITRLEKQKQHVMCKG